MEKGETPLNAAKRELFEETGAIEYELIPVWDFQNFTDDGVFCNNGRTYFARITKFTDLPSNEMSEINFFDELPDNVTYKKDEMTAWLLKAEKYASAHWE